MERKVFAHLPLSGGPDAHDTLSQSGFRRSQNVVYRPACLDCNACMSARLPVQDYRFSRSERKILERNGDLIPAIVKSRAMHEQYELLRRYLTTRHPDGGMADMSWADYVAMVEDTAVRTHVVEYRTLPTSSSGSGKGALVACALVDRLTDGLSLVYSFYDPALPRRSLGSFIILDHVRQAQQTDAAYVYLGYWVRGSEKMAYKARFDPLEVLGPQGWRPLHSHERVDPLLS